MTDDMLNLFMTPRPLLWRGVKTDTLLPLQGGKLAEPPVLGGGQTPGSKNQAKKERKMQRVAEKKLHRTREKGITDTGAGATTLGTAYPFGVDTRRHEA